MAYLIAEIVMTVTVLGGHSSNANSFSAIFVHLCFYFWIYCYCYM